MIYFFPLPTNHRKYLQIIFDMLLVIYKYKHDLSIIKKIKCLS